MYVAILCVRQLSCTHHESKSLLNLRIRNVIHKTLKTVA